MSKDRLTAAALCLALAGGIIFSAGCEPKALSQGTVEVNYSEGGSGSGCSFEADVDGNDAVTLSYGQFYTFPDTVTPGSHTLHMTFMSNTCNAVTCTFTNSGTHKVNYGFSVDGGDIYEANINTAGNCYTWTVSGS